MSNARAIGEVSARSIRRIAQDTPPERVGVGLTTRSLLGHVLARVVAETQHRVRVRVLPGDCPKDEMWSEGGRVNPRVAREGL